MKEIPLISGLERLCNVAELSGIVVMLFMAFALQLMFHELPCPLCLLQRVGFFGIALGFLLNLRYGLRPSHYSIIILSALFTSFVALRQIALHVVPGTGSYGDAFLGLHLYTWSFIISMIVIIMTTAMLGFDRQYSIKNLPDSRFRLLTSILFGLVLILVGMNVISVLLECGLTSCPDNPTQDFLPFKI
jgi:disulfide bond formation protein DsbB